MRPSINQISSFYPMKFSSFLLGSLIMLYRKANTFDISKDQKILYFLFPFFAIAFQIIHLDHSELKIPQFLLHSLYIGKKIPSLSIKNKVSG